MKYFKLTSAAIFACATLSANAAQQQIKADENIVITASRSEQSRVNVLSSISILTRSEIEASPAQSVAELLEQVNGIQVANSGGAGQIASVYTRGTNTGHTLVIIDGQRISSATLGQVAFANIPTEQIERIEIIKGARASIWGSDAIGGVIQIFTRQLDAGEVALDFGVGNDAQQQASLSAALGHVDGATTLTIAGRSSNGYDVFSTDEGGTPEPDHDGYRRESASIIGYQNLDNNWKINWLAKYDQGNTEFDTPAPYANETDLKTQQWQLSATQNNDQWQHKFSLGQQINETNSYGNGTAAAAGDLYKTKRLQTNWVGHHAISSTLDSTVGIDFTRENVTTNTVYKQTKRDLKAIFGHLSYDNANLILEGSLRYDDIEKVGSELTYNAGAGLRLKDGSQISVNVGHGFKAPSFNDLYYPASAWGSGGNPGLVPETSDNIEWLLTTTLGPVNTELSVYRTKIDHLISWGASQPININQVTIKGTELVLDGQAFGFNHQLQLAYLDAKDLTTDQQLDRRARHSGSYQLSYDWQQLQLATSINYQGKRQDRSKPLSSNTLVNFSASYQIDNYWKIAVKANNVLDKEYISAYDFGGHYVGQPAQYLMTLSYRQ